MPTPPDVVERLLAVAAADTAAMLDRIADEREAVERMLATNARLPIRLPYHPPPTAVTLHPRGRPWRPPPETPDGG